jgi:hypothetical protein
MKTTPPTKATDRNADAKRDDEHHSPLVTRPREIGGPRGPEPTRYGDWERKGRCIDF